MTRGRGEWFAVYLAIKVGVVIGISLMEIIK